MSKFFQIFILWGFLSSFILSSPAVAQHSSASSPSLTLSIIISKRVLKLNDPVRIGCILKNDGSQSIWLKPDRYIYPIWQLELTDLHQNEMKSFQKGYSDPAIEWFDEFTEVELGKQVVVEYQAILKKGMTYYVPEKEKGPPYLEGIFLDFRMSAFLLGADHRYLLRCHYEMSPEYAERAKQAGASDRVWVGEIVSEPIELIIMDE
ncbi:MAG: hypothetical protein MPW16_20230 [Candidatus Manganitrophus sp.]|nr:MAG: hypothetical protein MPW16_20230 [Candidatus Manganitrophus sp.]